MTTIAIDLGASNTVVTVSDEQAGDSGNFRSSNSIVTVVRDEFHNETRPSVIWYNDQTGDVLTGWRAQTCGHSRGGLVRFPKAALGTEETFPVGSQQWDAQQIATRLIEACIDDVERSTGVSPDRAVLTHPVWFTERALDSLKAAARFAGLSSTQLIPEPLAAARAILDDDRPQRCLMLDFGGSGATVSLLDRYDGQTKVIGIDSVPEAGGQRFDEQIARRLSEQLANAGYETDFTTDTSGKNTLWEELLVCSEKLKLQLSVCDSDCREAFFLRTPDESGRPIQIDVGMNRQEFESLVAPAVHAVVNSARQVLNEQSCGPEDIDTVLLAGGSSCIPLVQQSLIAEFGEDRIRDGRNHFPVASGAVLTSNDAMSENSDGLAASQDCELEDDALNTDETGSISPPRSELNMLLSQVYDILRRVDDTRHELEVETIQIVERTALEAWAHGDEPAWQQALRALDNLKATLPKPPNYEAPNATLPEPPILQHILVSEVARMEHEVALCDQVGDEERAVLSRTLQEIAQCLRQVDTRHNESAANELLAIIQERIVPLQHRFDILSGNHRQSSAGFVGGDREPNQSPQSAVRPIKNPARKQSEIPATTFDRVHFSATSPDAILPGIPFVVDIWAHLEKQRQEVLKRAREQAGSEEIAIRSKGPVKVSRGALLTVTLRVTGGEVDPLEDTILWDGEVGNASFFVTINEQTSLSQCPGVASLRIGGLEIARLNFLIRVGETKKTQEPLQIQETRHERVFASYATDDTDAVLDQIQGMLKYAPDIDVFFAPKSIRSGENWRSRLEQEIRERDKMYLFWSLAASRSEWVKREWQAALDQHGVDFIDPCPLAPPEEVPPPKELADHMHFNEWTLAYKRRSV